MYKNILVKNLEKKYMIMYAFAINQKDLGEENSTCLNLSKILSFKLDTEGKNTILD